MNMMAFYQKRTVAQGARGIGSWGGIVELLSFIGIGVNCGIIFWTSSSLSIILEDYDYTDAQKFMVIVLIEHCIIGFKLFLANVIKDKPEWVAKAERRQNEEEENLYELLDRKADELRS